MDAAMVKCALRLGYQASALCLWYCSDSGHPGEVLLPTTTRSHMSNMMCLVHAMYRR